MNLKSIVKQNSNEKKKISNQMPFFSIITVCRNEEKRIQKTLDSVINQSINDFEYIIIDGMSDDETLNIINTWNRDKSINVTVLSERDTGVYDAMNKGIKRAKGEYLFFLNAGDVFYDNKVLEHIRAEIYNTKPRIWVGAIWVIDNHREYVREPIEPTATFQNGLGYSHQALFARNDVIKDGFNTKYKIYADYAWECKQYVEGMDFQIGKHIVCRYIENGISAQNSRIKERWKELFSIWKDFLPDYYEKRINTWKEDWELEKGNIRLKLLHELFDLTLKRINILKYVVGANDKSIAVYGFGDVGQCLVDKLVQDGAGNIMIIDRAYKDYSRNIRVLRPDEDLSSVDILIVTPIVDFYEIRDALFNKYSFTIISIEELINNIYSLYEER